MSQPSAPESALVPPLRDVDRIVELICGLTSDSPNEIRRRLKTEYSSMGTSVREALRAKSIEPHVWSEQLERFYEQTDAFLFETIVWNLTHAKCYLRAWIGEYLRSDSEPKSILTFGDGLGFDSFYLAAAGHKVTYFEVSRPCAEFAKTIFADHQLAVEVIVDPREIEGRKLAVIVCLDVLEHVPDPIGLVQWLSEMLKPGGKLIVSAPFFLIDQNVQTHLKSNRKFSGDYRRLFAPAGLSPVAGRLFWNPIVLQKTEANARQSNHIPSKIRLGGLLLKLARIWSLPFTQSNNSIVKQKHPLKFRT